MENNKENWKDIHKEFYEETYFACLGNIETYQQRWKNAGFDYQGAKEWIKAGFKLDDYYWIKEWKKQSFAPAETRQWLNKGLNKNNANFAKFLLSKGYTPTSFPNESKLNELKEKYLANDSDWSVIHKDFAESITHDDFAEKNRDWGCPPGWEHTWQQVWEKNDFAYQEAQQWIQAGFEPSDYQKIKQWKNHGFTPQQAWAWLAFVPRQTGYETWGTDPRAYRVKRRDSLQSNMYKDHDFAAYLRSKGYQPGQNLNLEQLKKEYTALRTPQEYLDFFYPQEQRNTIKKLNFSQKNLAGPLDLNDFVNLEALYCWDNQLTELKLDNCSKLKKINCEDNRLQNLKFPSQVEQLMYLDIRNNPLFGSLKPLRDLKKLKELDIKDTDINSGLEYLPESVEKFNCSVRRKEDAKVQAIYDLLANEYGKVETDKDGYIRDFSQKLQDYKQWRKLDFPEEEIKQWINAGAKPDDYKFVAWLRDIKNYEPEWITNYKEDYEILSNRFKKYDLCSEWKCKQPNTGDQWCQACNAPRLQKGFAKWTSHNPEIDKFIQKYQLAATEANKFLEWIPYEQFKDIEYLAEGGFGKVYKAKWPVGNINHWDAESNQWHRKKDHYYEEEKDEWGYSNKVKKYKDYREVVLKSLNNSQDNTDFLQETEKHKLIDDWFNNIVPCYGLSQDPKTGDYLMVMQYMLEGNLRHYLNNKNQELSLEDKLSQLVNIARGLKDIHNKT